MGQQFSEIQEKHADFVCHQKLFFVGTATDNSRVNISPKGMDSLRILSKNRVIWLNLTGSGNETSAHIQQHPRMTLLFTAFEGNPLILRFYGDAKVVHRGDAAWDDLYRHFPDSPGARQIFDLNVDLVQTSCGMAVPYYDYVGDRTLLHDWAVKKGGEGLRQYWQKKNQTSIDGLPTQIVEKNIRDN